MTTVLLVCAVAFVVWQTVLAIRWFVTLGSYTPETTPEEPISEAEKWYRHEMRKYDRGNHG